LLNTTKTGLIWSFSTASTAYCKQQSLIYHQFVYWHQRLTSAENNPKQVLVATGFTRVVSVPGVGTGDTDGLTVHSPFWHVDAG